jgi:hypothetical protein
MGLDAVPPRSHRPLRITRPDGVMDVPAKWNLTKRRRPPRRRSQLPAPMRRCRAERCSVLQGSKPPNPSPWNSAGFPRPDKVPRPRRRRQRIPTKYDCRSYPRKSPMPRSPVSAGGENRRFARLLRAFGARTEPGLSAPLRGLTIRRFPPVKASGSNHFQPRPRPMPSPISESLDAHEVMYNNSN